MRRCQDYYLAQQPAAGTYISATDWPVAVCYRHPEYDSNTLAQGMNAIESDLAYVLIIIFETSKQQRADCTLKSHVIYYKLIG